jgi:hypothetical protein
MNYIMAGLTDNDLMTFFDDLLIYGYIRKNVVQRTQKIF